MCFGLPKGEIPFWYHHHHNNRHVSTTLTPERTQVKVIVIRDPWHTHLNSTVRSKPPNNCLGAMIRKHSSAILIFFLPALISAARQLVASHSTTTYNLFFVIFFPEHMPRIVVRFRHYWTWYLCGPQK